MYALQFEVVETLRGAATVRILHASPAKDV